MSLHRESASSPIASQEQHNNNKVATAEESSRIFATALNSVLLLQSDMPSLSFLDHLPTVFYAQERSNVVAVAMAIEQR